MEVGPLARMVVGYASGKKEIVDAVNGALKPERAAGVLFSTLGRIAARALEAQLMARSSTPGSASWTTISPRQDHHLQSGEMGSGFVAEDRQRLRMA